MTHSRFDYVLVGGGLQNGLIALALSAARPDCRIALVERAPKLAGNHTWCFHSGDIEPELDPIVAELVVRSWSGYDVAFSDLERSLDEPYAAVTSERLAEVVGEALTTRNGSELLLEREVTSIASDHVLLASGERLNGDVIVDARGPGGVRTAGAVAFQKFVGLELALERPCTRTRPMLMDARVAQRDGFRFFYVLPLDVDRVLVEETFFSDTPELDRPGLRASIIAYAREAGMSARAILREESGVLPLPSRADLPQPTRPLRAGYLGGWFHPTTGYSFPVAARLAGVIAKSSPEELFGGRLERAWAEHARQLRFACFLNRLLFGACAPEHRASVLERFYRLPAATIRRFYALSTTTPDRARIVCGRPPRGVSIRAAIQQGVLS